MPTTTMNRHNTAGRLAMTHPTNRHHSRLRLPTAIAAAILAATACSSTEDTAPGTTAAATATTEAPSPTTTTTTAPTAAPVPATTEAPAAPTPPTTTEAPAAPTPPTTTEAPTAEPAPTVTIWSSPRLHDTTLSASWQVVPDDATCQYELINANGEVIGDGVADTTGDDPKGRGMRADYDPASADSLGTVTISCSLLGGEAAVSTHPVHRVEYQNRHPDSVIAATDDHYFDHEEVAALFVDCRPGERPWRPNDFWPLGVNGKPRTDEVDVDGDGRINNNDWLDASADFWEEAFDNWDTETVSLGPIEIASGWWTARQLLMYYPKSNITPAAAREYVTWDPTWGDYYLLRGPDFEGPGVNIDWEVFPLKYDNRTYNLKSLYHRLEYAVGYVSEYDGRIPTKGKDSRWIRDDRIAGEGDPNPPRVRVVPGDLLWDWMDARYSFPPFDREPTAWAMRTLLEARDSYCVEREMRAHCESGEFHPSRHMRNRSQGGSRLGSILWSAICPELVPDAQ